jgi:hypothetical protein
MRTSDKETAPVLCPRIPGPALAVLCETSNLPHRLFKYVGIMLAWSAILGVGVRVMPSVLFASLVALGLEVLVVVVYLLTQYWL